jgi:hypothetical protein
MMSTAPAVYDRGRSSAPSSITCQASPDDFVPELPTGNPFRPTTTISSIVGGSPPPSPSLTVPTLAPVQALRQSPKIFIQPTTTALTAPAPTTTRGAKSHTFFLVQWLPPSCQSSCFLSVGTMLIFPGTNILLPTLLLKPTLPYIYECSCNNDGSDHVDVEMPSNPSKCSPIIAVSELSHLFSGVMFSQVL